MLDLQGCKRHVNPWRFDPPEPPDGAIAA